MRAIDGDALYKKLNDIRKEEIILHGRLNNKNCCTLSTALFEIDCAPTIEPERKKGKWIEYDNSHCECPFCHEEWSYFDNEVEYFNFCPNCGADNREDKNVHP